MYFEQNIFLCISADTSCPIPGESAGQQPPPPDEDLGKSNSYPILYILNQSFFSKECEASDQVLPKKIPIPSCHIPLLCVMC